MSSIGRLRHAMWNEGFKRYRDPKTGKNLALCLICHKTVTNTAQERLQNHRKSCRENFTDSENGNCSSRIKYSRRSGLSLDPVDPIDIGQQMFNPIEEVEVCSGSKRLKIEKVESFVGTDTPSFWDYFTRIRHPSQNKSVALCQICNKIISNTARDRLISHRGKCPIRQISRDNHADDEYSDPENDLSNDAGEQSNTTEWTSRNYQQSSSESLQSPSNDHQRKSDGNQPITSQTARLEFERMTDDEKQGLDELFGMYVFSCKDPLKAAESFYLRKLIKSLRPDYDIPTTEELQTKIKDQCKKQFLLSLTVASNLFDEDEEVKKVLSTLEKKM